MKYQFASNLCISSTNDCGIDSLFEIHQYLMKGATEMLNKEVEFRNRPLLSLSFAKPHDCWEGVIFNE